MLIWVPREARKLAAIMLKCQLDCLCRKWSDLGIFEEFVQTASVSVLIDANSGKAWQMFLITFCLENTLAHD